MSPLATRPANVKFLLDENVDVRLSSFLKKREFSVLTPPKGLKNGAVLALAEKESCILVTNDKDFTNVESSKVSALAGIVVLRIHPPSLAKLESAFGRLLEKFSPKELSGKIVFLSETGVEVKNASKLIL